MAVIDKILGTPLSHNHTDEFVNIDGDTMTGKLILSGVPTINLHAATKKYVDDNTMGGNIALKYHLTPTDNFTILQNYQYNVVGGLILDSGAQLTINEGGELNLL